MAKNVDVDIGPDLYFPCLKISQTKSSLTHCLLNIQVSVMPAVCFFANL